MNKNEFLSDVIRGLVEGNTNQKFREISVRSLPKCNCSKTLSEALCLFENEIGGRFELKKINASKSVIWGLKCPFGDNVKGRPHLCSLTESFFTTMTDCCCPGSKVKILKSIARGDDKCVITISFKKTFDIT